MNFLRRTVTGTTISGKARELPFAARYKVSDSIISFTILSLASCVFMCFFASFRETRVSGIALSCRGFGFELKKLRFDVSRG